MAHLHFTRQLARFLDAPTVDVAAPRLRAALDAAFAQQPRLRGYVLDEQGALRPNVVIFIDGARCRERRTPIQPTVPAPAAAGPIHHHSAISATSGSTSPCYVRGPRARRESGTGAGM